MAAEKSGSEHHNGAASQRSRWCDPVGLKAGMKWFRMFHDVDIVALTTALGILAQNYQSEQIESEDLALTDIFHPKLEG